MGEAAKEPVCFPLGLAYLASTVNDHQLLTFDPNIALDPMIRLRKMLERENPDVVAVSLRNVDSVISFGIRSYYEPFVHMLKAIRNSAPEVKIIVGGAGFSIFAEEIMESNPEIDIGVVGEAELIFSKLIENLNHADRIKGLWVRTGKDLFFTGRAPLPNFDRIPTPSWELFDLEKYKESHFSMGIQSKRGCVFGCIYCLNRHLQGNHYRANSPRKVVDEIENLVDNFGIDEFYFVDPVFNSPVEHSRKICEETLRRKLETKWIACFREDMVNFQTMNQAVKAGCELFDFSPDGASNESLRVLGKNIAISHVEKSCKLVASLEGISVNYNFLYDLPSANKEHFKGFLHLLPRISIACGGRVTFSLSRIRIYPHTRIFDTALQDGRILPGQNMIKPVYYTGPSSFKNPYVILTPALFKIAYALQTFQNIRRHFGRIREAVNLQNM